MNYLRNTILEIGYNIQNMMVTDLDKPWYNKNEMKENDFTWAEKSAGHKLSKEGSAHFFAGGHKK